MILPFYFIIKYLAYALWSALGLKVFTGTCQFRYACSLGALRFFLGIIFGFFILLLVQFFTQKSDFSLETYLYCYVSVRIIEWSIIFYIIKSRFKESFHSHPYSTSLWIAGGITISCLADIPIFILFGGFPVGRFLC